MYVCVCVHMYIWLLYNKFIMIITIITYVYTNSVFILELCSHVLFMELPN